MSKFLLRILCSVLIINGATFLVMLVPSLFPMAISLLNGRPAIMESASNLLSGKH